MISKISALPYAGQLVVRKRFDNFNEEQLAISEVQLKDIESECSEFMNLSVQQ